MKTINKQIYKQGVNMKTFNEIKYKDSENNPPINKYII